MNREEEWEEEQTEELLVLFHSAFYGNSLPLTDYDLQREKDVNNSESESMPTGLFSQHEMKLMKGHESR